MKKILSVLIVLLVAALVVVGLMAWLRPSGPSAEELFATPETNAYPSLVRLSQQINGTPPSEDAEIDIDTLNELVTSNSNVLAGIRRELPKPSAVPVQFTQNSVTNHLNQVGPLKKLARLLRAEASVAEEEENWDAAARTYLDIVEFGQAVSRNGLLIDWMVGAGAAELGYRGLQGIADNLSQEACRRYTTQLEQIEAQRETYDAILKRERAWSRKIGGFSGMLVRILTPGMLEKNYKRVESKYNASSRRAASTLTNLAARAYRLDHGKPPKSPKALVGDYLSRVPEALAVSQ